MASTNQSPAYQRAEVKFLEAQTTELKLKHLKDMIRECPKHKSSEKMRANLKNRYRKLKYAKEKETKKKKSGKQGIRKEDMQAVIIGFTNTGKSSLLSVLTNANPRIASQKEVFSTRHPEVGMVNYSSGIQIQLIEIPSFESEYYDKSLANTADVILILVTDLEQINKIKKELDKTRGKKVIVFNKSDLFNEQEKRKTIATLQSKKHDFVLISTKTKEGIEELKEKIFQKVGKMRVYTKEPRKDQAVKPIIMKEGSTVGNIAEKILKGFSKKVKQTKIWGPSSKFSGQVVGLKHVLKDLDVVEFKTR
jgi:small GTP-binding protein